METPEDFAAIFQGRQILQTEVYFPGSQILPKMGLVLDERINPSLAEHNMPCLSKQ